MSKKQKTKKTNSAKLTNHQVNELEVIAKRMDGISKRRLRDGTIRSGVLNGMEPEIRQEAIIMSVGGFLQRNADYIEARRKNDDIASQSAMEKCMAIALAIVKRRIASRLTYELARNKALTEENGGTGHHQSQIQPSDWSRDVKNIMIMRAVHTAVQHGKLSVPNACIVSMICDDGMTVHEVAQATRITRSAVYQQINRVRRVIPEIIEEMEIPLS